MKLVERRQFSSVFNLSCLCDVTVLHVGLRERSQDDGDDAAADELRRVPICAAGHDWGKWVKDIIIT